MENSTKVRVSDGRFFTNEKNMGLIHWILHDNHFKTHLFFSLFGEGILFISDPGLKAGSNLEGLWRSYLTSVRSPISKRVPINIYLN